MLRWLELLREVLLWVGGLLLWRAVWRWFDHVPGRRLSLLPARGVWWITGVLVVELVVVVVVVV